MSAFVVKIQKGAEMSETKYGKYIITDLKEKIVAAPWSAGRIKPIPRAGKKTGGRLLWLDSEIIPDSFYVETAWAFPRQTDEGPTTPALPHTHDYDEVLCMCGTNFEDPYDLGGEVEFFMGGERHVLTRSCLIFIPKGLEHGPLNYVRVDTPIFNFSTGASSMYF
jgi:hypothetical protein